MRFFVLLVLVASAYGNPPQVINMGTRVIPRFHNQYSDLVARMLRTRGVNVYSVFDVRGRSSPSVIPGGFGDFETSGLGTSLDRAFVRSSAIARGPSISYRELYQDGGLARPSTASIVSESVRFPPSGPDSITRFDGNGDFDIPGFDGNGDFGIYPLPHNGAYPGGAPLGAYPLGPDGSDGNGDFGPASPGLSISRRSILSDRNGGFGPASPGLSISGRSILSSQRVVGPEFDRSSGVGGIRSESLVQLPPGHEESVFSESGLNAPGGIGPETLGLNGYDELDALSGRSSLLTSSSSASLVPRVNGRRSALRIYESTYPGYQEFPGYSIPYVGTSSSSSGIYDGFPGLHSASIPGRSGFSVRSFRTGSFPSLSSSSAFRIGGPTIYGPTITRRRVVTYPGRIQIRRGYPAYNNIVRRSGGLLSDFGSSVTSGLRSTNQVVGGSFKALQQDYSNYLQTV